jgi:hypothetical protein
MQKGAAMVGSACMDKQLKKTNLYKVLKPIDDTKIIKWDTNDGYEFTKSMFTFFNEKLDMMETTSQVQVLGEMLSLYASCFLGAATGKTVIIPDDKKLCIISGEDGQVFHVVLVLHVVSRSSLQICQLLIAIFIQGGTSSASYRSASRS